MHPPKKCGAENVKKSDDFLENLTIPAAAIDCSG